MWKWDYLTLFSTLTRQQVQRLARRGFFVGIADDDIDITAQPRQQAHQAFNGYVAELAIEDARYIGLADPEM